MSNLTYPEYTDVEDAAMHMPPGLITETPFFRHEGLSQQYDADIWMKDETAQLIRSYKIRGAFNAIRKLPDDGRKIVCASAGNHAQGVAISCNFLKRHGVVFMPKTTPLQKQEATKRFGNGFVEVILVGDAFDEAAAAAQEYTKQHDAAFIHPFDNKDVIAGQGTIALEMFRKKSEIDYILGPVGGGGLMSGVSLYTKHYSPNTRLVGVEPKEAAAMDASLKAGHPVTLPKMSTFVDGAAVLRPGDLTFEMIRRNVDEIRTVSENRVCATFMELHDIHGLHMELAGALSIDALQDIRGEIRGKTVACILSGNNFDLRKSASVVERAERYKGQKIYLRILLPERPRALRDLLDAFNDDVGISYIHYDELGDTNTSGTEQAHLLLGAKCAKPGMLVQLQESLKQHGFPFENISNNPLLHEMLGR